MNPNFSSVRSILQAIPSLFPSQPAYQKTCSLGVRVSPTVRKGVVTIRLAPSLTVGLLHFGL